MALSPFGIARLWIRGDGKLGLAAVLPGQDGLKPDRVYEISLVAGELVISDAGPSCIAPSGEPSLTPGATGMSTSCDAGTILRTGMFKYTLGEFLEKFPDHVGPDLPAWAKSAT